MWKKRYVKKAVMYPRFREAESGVKEGAEYSSVFFDTRVGDFYHFHDNRQGEKKQGEIAQSSKSKRARRVTGRSGMERERSK
jgi:hypothetical protein